MRPRADDWLYEAEEALAAARDLAAQGHYNQAAFWAQQGGEMALKAAYVQLHGDTPPRTHELRSLAQMVFGEAAQEISEPLAELEPHYLLASYPSPEMPRPSDSYRHFDAEEAVRVCSELLTWVRSHLPESD